MVVVVGSRCIGGFGVCGADVVEASYFVHCVISREEHTNYCPSKLLCHDLVGPSLPVRFEAFIAGCGFSCDGFDNNVEVVVRFPECSSNDGDIILREKVVLVFFSPIECKSC